MSEGILDSNILVSALTNDVHSEECKTFLNELRDGTQSARLEALVLHELAYVLLRVFKLDRKTIVGYMNEVVSWPGVIGDKDLLLATIDVWFRNPGLSFVDAYLGSLAQRLGLPVYTKNIKDFEAQQAIVPNPLPRSDRSNS